MGRAFGVIRLRSRSDQVRFDFYYNFFLISFRFDSQTDDNKMSRELAYQIAEQFTALGSGIGVRVAVIVGGMDTMSQALALAKKPHIVVATPGRLQDHLENTKGFSLRTLKYLVRASASTVNFMKFMN